MKRIILIFAFLMIPAIAFSTDLIFPKLNQLDLGGVIEQAERIKQMQLQNEMLEQKIKQNRIKDNSEDDPKEAFKAGFTQGYSTGYKVGIDAGVEKMSQIIFSSTSTEELIKFKKAAEEILKENPDTYRFKAVIILIDQRLSELKEINPRPYRLRSLP